MKLQINRVKEVLRQQGRSQTWLAEKLDKSYVVVTNYCNNNKQPSLEVLRQIADILDIDVRELLTPTKIVDWHYFLSINPLPTAGAKLPFCKWRLL